ncbi:polar amino acid transport system substrate-binding protein [Oxalobacteraceae bacterium GrIS 1.11]
MRQWKAVGTILAAALAMGAGQAGALDRQLLIIGEEHPPYEMLDANGKVVGINIDIATRIFDKLGVHFTVEILPWKRVWQMFQTGEADAGITISRNEERARYLIFPTENLWVSEFVFFTHVDKLQALPLGYDEALKQKLKVGVIAGNSYHPSFWLAFPYQDAEKTRLHPQLESAATVELNFRKLAHQRFDVFPFDRESGRYELLRLHLENTITPYPSVLFSKGYTMAFVKNSTYPNLPKIAEQFEHELIALKKSGEYQKLQDKWFKHAR